MKHAAKAYVGGFFGALGVAGAVIGVGAVLALVAQRELKKAQKDFMAAFTGSESESV